MLARSDVIQALISFITVSSCFQNISSARFVKTAMLSQMRQLMSETTDKITCVAIVEILIAAAK